MKMQKIKTVWTSCIRFLKPNSHRSIPFSDSNRVPKTEPFSKVVKLSGYNFVGGNFRHADFSGASFQDVILTNADLSCAQLTASDFRRAVISGTDFTDANLSKAKLRGCIQDGNYANFTRTNLSGADLSCLQVSNTIQTATIDEYTSLDGVCIVGGISLKFEEKLQSLGWNARTQCRKGETHTEVFRSIDPFAAG